MKCKILEYHYSRNVSKYVPKHTSKALWFRTLISPFFQNIPHSRMKFFTKNKKRIKKVTSSILKINDRDAVSEKFISSQQNIKLHKWKKNKRKIKKKTNINLKTTTTNDASQDLISSYEMFQCSSKYFNTESDDNSVVSINKREEVEITTCCNNDSICPLDFEDSDDNNISLSKHNLKNSFVFNDVVSNEKLSRKKREIRTSCQPIQYDLNSVEIVNCSSSIDNIYPINLNFLQNDENIVENISKNNKLNEKIKPFRKKVFELPEQVDNSIVNSDYANDKREDIQTNNSLSTEIMIWSSSKNIDKKSKAVCCNISSNISILVLHHPLEVIIKGIAQVEVLKESITIYGYQLDETKPSISVCSLRKFGFITITTNPSNITSSTWKSNIERKLENIQNGLFLQMKSIIKRKSIVILLKLQKLSHIEFSLLTMERSIFQNYKNCVQTDLHKLELSLVDNNTKELACNIDYHRRSLALMLNEVIRFSREQKQSTPRILVCGGKDSGKSTLLRYLMNNTLNKCTKCYFLECDIGQTEFTPPGCVSLTCVDKPAFGPPFSHLKTPEKMYFLGSVTVLVPDDYIAAIIELLQYYMQYCSEFPLFINTMGWTRGLGLSLMIDIIYIIQPSHIIHLMTEGVNSVQNFYKLTPEYVFETDGWKFTKAMKISLHEYYLEEIPSLAHTGSKKISAIKNRSLAIMSYLGQLQSDFTIVYKPINSFQPYTVAWSDVALHVCHYNVPSDHILHAFIASWVALCQIKDLEVYELPDYSDLKILKTFHNSVCFGFGIIRGIDAIRKLIYIITPEPIERLQLVNVLVKGNVNFPEDLLKSQEVIHPPYIGIME